MDSVRQADTPAALRAVSNDSTLMVLRRLMAAPATLSQLGREFEKHPAWIRHHVMALIDAGLVTLHEERTTRNYTERFYRATAPAFTINLLIGPEDRTAKPLMLLGSHDLAVEALAGMQAYGTTDTPMTAAAIGSLDGLIALRQGLADVAGCHLMDFASGEYNTPFVRSIFPDRPVIMVTVATREQGLVVAPGNPHGVKTVADVIDAGLTIANRNLGSGTRIWFDHELQRDGIEPASVRGYDSVAVTHTEAAEAVAAGHADATIAIRAAAEACGMGFVELFTERYDLVFDARRTDEPAIAALLEHLESRAFRRTVSGMPGYDTAQTGREETIAL